MRNTLWERWLMRRLRDSRNSENAWGSGRAQWRNQTKDMAISTKSLSRLILCLSAATSSITHRKRRRVIARKRAAMILLWRLIFLPRSILLWEPTSICKACKKCREYENSQCLLFYVSCTFLEPKNLFLVVHCSLLFLCLKKLVGTSLLSISYLLVILIIISYKNLHHLH